MMRSLLAALLLVPAIAAAQVGTASTTTIQIGTQIDSLATKAGRLPADRRGSLVAPLKAMGPAAVDVMIQRLNADSAAMTALKTKSPAAHAAFVAALLDALGTFRSARAESTFVRLLEAQDSSPLVAHMAADGLGRLCTTSSIETLKAHARTEDLRANEAASGLGMCRTETSATVLTGWLSTHPPAETTRAIAQSLGMLGSSWAWEALGPTRAAEGRQLRSSVASALMAEYPHTEGVTARAIMSAVLMVDSPTADAAIRQLADKDTLRVRWTRQHAR